MRGRKTVTEKKLAANRLNAQHSTGPRTVRGKDTSRLNGLITGMFATLPVIPLCDGDPAREETDPYPVYEDLHLALLREYRPQTPTEEFCVTQMAECIWKQRRRIRAEKASALLAVQGQSGLIRIMEGLEPFRKGVCILEGAEKEIEATRTLSQTAYDAVLAQLELARTQGANHPKLEIENNGSASKGQIDAQFVACIKEAKKELQQNYDIIGDFATKSMAAFYADNAIPPEAEMNRNFRYDNKLQKKFAYSRQQLLECQERRRAAEREKLLVDQTQSTRSATGKKRRREKSRKVNNVKQK
jgi:hypothetical protein